MPHEESYLSKGRSTPCLMEEGRDLIEEHRHAKTFPQVLVPSHLREAEGLGPEAWSRGWPLVTAKRADSPRAEGGREVRREEGNASQGMVPFLSPSIRRPRRLRHAVLELAPAR